MVSWNSMIGIGVAGNFTGHLEQAGEASDFVDIRPQAHNAPKGVFPFYVPKGRAEAPHHFLNTMPISSDTIRLRDRNEKYQVEPELALICDLTYSEGEVTGIEPRWAVAHNDCSIRRDGASKISEKKNWGRNSKGTSIQRIGLDKFSIGGILDHYRLACFLVRDGQTHAYGIDSPLTGYSYFYGELLIWLQQTLNDQRDHGPLEDMSHWLKVAGYPAQALMSIGATRYTPFGESHYLRDGDEVIVAVYDGLSHAPDDLFRMAQDGDFSALTDASVLKQTVCG